MFTLAGAPAIGASSFGVALARGYPHGQRIPGAAHLIPNLASRP